MTDFWGIELCCLVEVDWRFRGAYCLHYPGVLMMEAERTSETSVYFRDIPQGYHLHATPSIYVLASPVSVTLKVRVLYEIIWGDGVTITAWRCYGKLILYFICE
jgi:hypothetical protein